MPGAGAWGGGAGASEYGQAECFVHGSGFAPAERVAITLPDGVAVPFVRITRLMDDGGGQEKT